MGKIERIKWIDYTKAFACFLVVLGHLLQSFQNARIDNNIEITSFIIWFIYLFHMPLFMCMSGYLYLKNKKIFSWKNYKKFFKKKVINLGIPYITFYLLYLGINVLFSSSVNTPKGIDELIGIFNNPMAPYWFLYALLSIFMIIPILEKIFNNNENVIFAFLCILKILSIFIKTKIYFIDAFMSNSLYFYFSIFINFNRKNSSNKKNIIKVGLICYVALALIIYQYRLNIDRNVLELFKIGMAISGIIIIVEIFKDIKKSKILDTFSKYTFQIYLTHTIFAAAFRIIFLKIGITNYFIHLIFGILVSIYLPVGMSIISDKIKYTNIFIYPIKTINELKERKKLKCQKKN